MNGLPEWNKQPSGWTPEKPAQQKRSAGLLLSGVLIAISLLAFILPLAAYHAAQVASILRLRSAVFLISVVSLLLYVLGIVTRLPVFVMAGTTGLFSIPFLAVALFVRVNNRSAWWALLILAVPLLFALVSMLSVPQGFNIMSWLSAEFAKMPPSASTAQHEAIINQMKASPAIGEIQKLFDLVAWQRLAWFLFVDGGALSILLFATLLGTLVLIDFAFNQTERMRAVINYVVAHRESFPVQVVAVLEQTMVGLRSLVGQAWSGQAVAKAHTAEVVTHEKKPLSAKKTAPQDILSSIWRRPGPPGTSDILGYRFTLINEPGWNLKYFAVPLWLSAPALALLVYLASLWQGEKELATWLPAAPTGAVLSVLGCVAMGVLSGLSLQGALVIYSCMRPFAALILMFALLLILSALKAGPLLLVVGLAGLGLLDNVYDFRNRLAKTKNAV